MNLVLIVDGELPVLHALHRWLQRHFKPQQLAVELCVDPLHKLQRLHGMHFDVPIGDHRMRGWTNGEVLMPGHLRPQPGSL